MRSSTWGAHTILWNASEDIDGSVKNRVSWLPPRGRLVDTARLQHVDVTGLDRLEAKRKLEKPECEWKLKLKPRFGQASFFPIM